MALAVNQGLKPPIKLTNKSILIGQYQCRLSKVILQDLVHLVSTLDTYVQIRAVVTAREHQAEISSSVVSLPFLPAFYVHTQDLSVSNLQPLTSVRISANERVAQDIKVSACEFM